MDMSGDRLAHKLQKKLQSRALIDSSVAGAASVVSGCWELGWWEDGDIFQITWKQ